MPKLSIKKLVPCMLNFPQKSAKCDAKRFIQASRPRIHGLPTESALKVICVGFAFADLELKIN